MDPNDSATFLQACVERRLDFVEITIRPGSAVCVVLASHGYPGHYVKGKKIEMEEMPPGT
jgi:phosphoribosylamine--glycine ligase/phosphoribosylformylglycinamidine cyclo-ligase